MRIHVVIDFMHIYYKYFFQLREGKLKNLSIQLEKDGEIVEKETSLIYYSLRDIEGIRKGLEKFGHNVTMSICFDMPSQKRKEEDTEYKSGRTNNLTEHNFEDLDDIERLLRKAGHNTYRIPGYEADDIVNYLIRKYADSFDYSIIYTNDKDLLINIKDNVGVMRFKQYKGYTQVDINNYESYLEKEFKVFIPYNMLGLYLASAGDSADKIKGISKFGPKAFSKLMTKVIAKNEVNMKECGDYSKLEAVIKLCEEFLTSEQYEQLKKSFTLVANVEIMECVEEPSNISTEEKRRLAYAEYQMSSLI